ncbi:MAG: hypothetical protein HQK51_19315, partial [Oligoflexia bacterium]|nr:hypothetical protein [Oligoflexia bacterium]
MWKKIINSKKKILLFNLFFYVSLLLFFISINKSALCENTPTQLNQLNQLNFTDEIKDLEKFENNSDELEKLESLDISYPLNNDGTAYHKVYNDSYDLVWKALLRE